MSCNIANWDRALRILIGASLIFVGWAVVPGAGGLALKLLGLLPLLTGLVGCCPIYSALKISTK